MKTTLLLILMSVNLGCYSYRTLSASRNIFPRDVVRKEDLFEGKLWTLFHKKDFATEYDQLVGHKALVRLHQGGPIRISQVSR